MQHVIQEKDDNEALKIENMYHEKAFN